MNENQKYIADYIRMICLEQPKQLMYGKLPGTRYRSQYYMARALYNKEFLEKVGEEFHRLVEENIGNWNFQLAGREWSAIPLLISLPLFMKQKHDIDLNAFMIRKTRKTYGLNNYIEGMVNNKPILIVDDVVNSQDGYRHCHQVISKTTAFETVPYIFGVLNKYGKDTTDDGNALLYDRYLGNEHKILSVINGDNVYGKS